VTECRRHFITGRVQGVFFRDSARRQAEQLGLTGRAVNLDDGRVEVLACGAADALDRLEAWLHQGSPAARVTGVTTESVDETPPDRFSTG